MHRIKGYIIASHHETDRIENVKVLMSQFPLLLYQEAIYPNHQRVPFLSNLIELSNTRTGHRLTKGEIGCLLSHRNVWRKIVQRGETDQDLFLILESDSSIKTPNIIAEHFSKMNERFDIFFWGAWEGHMKLLKSTKRKLTQGVSFGAPLIKTVYCTYGYAVNWKAAAALLQSTAKIGYPVDQFKKYTLMKNLRIGGVSPEIVVTAGRKKSYIQQNRNRVKEFFLWKFLDFRNSIICYFK